jgi:hypothetical protein
MHGRRRRRSPAHRLISFASARSAGRQAGALEGRALGLRKGYEMGSELGFYSGCCQLWRQLQARSPAFLPPRADKAVAALEALVAEFPLGNAQVRPTV